MRNELLNQLNDPKQRFAAILLLGRLQHQPALPHLISFLTDTDAGTRWAAAYALGLLGDKSAIPALIPLLRDEDKQVRLAATRALGNLRARDSVTVLNALFNDPEPSVRAAADWALQQIENTQDSFGGQTPPELTNEHYRTDVLNWLMDSAGRVTGSEHAFIAMKNAATGNLEYQTGSGIEEQADQEKFVSGNAPLLSEVLTTGQPVLTNNAMQDPRFQGAESIIGFALRSMIAVPLMVGDEAVGVIYGDKRLKGCRSMKSGF